MKQTSFEIARQYLLDYLHDEFHKFPEVRLRIMTESHVDGVMAKTESRETFFPTEWIQNMRQDLIQGEVHRLKLWLPDRGEP